MRKRNRSYSYIVASFLCTFVLGLCLLGKAAYTDLVTEWEIERKKEFKPSVERICGDAIPEREDCLDYFYTSGGKQYLVHADLPKNQDVIVRIRAGKPDSIMIRPARDPYELPAWLIAVSSIGFFVFSMIAAGDTKKLR